MDPLVKRYIKTLDSTNVYSLDFRERDSIIIFFKAFKKLEVPFVPNEIKDFLISSGNWPHERVLSQAIKIIQDIKEGKSLKIRNRIYKVEDAIKKIKQWGKELENK